jgi:hypothetical protein
MKTGIFVCLLLLCIASFSKGEEGDDEKSKTLYKKMIARRREVNEWIFSSFSKTYFAKTKSF